MYHGRLLLSALLLLGPLGGQAAARPGATLAESLAIVRAQRVPIAVLVLREGRVLVEEWHSYTTPTQETGPAWPIAEAHAKRRAMMGDDGLGRPVEAARAVPWAGFPVWAFAYPGGRWAIYESKRGTDHVWALLGIADWHWSQALVPGFAMPADTQAYKLLHGKVVPLERPAVVVASPRPRATPTPGFWKPPGW